MIAIIDYGLGNLASVQKALQFLGLENRITHDHDVISEADQIILPGVGSFMQGMQNLKDRGLDTVLNQEVIVKKKPILGICLGMQLIFETGTEPFLNNGLGWIKGSVVKFEDQGLRIPHMGWNNIGIRKGHVFPEDIGENYYFIHSYHVVPEDETVIAATVNYGVDVVASIQYNNITATQFHPEKSQDAGLNFLKNYFSSNA